MINGAIFDVDGTLFDSMFIWNTIGEDYLRTIGFEPKENLNETFKAMSLYQAACYYRSEYGVMLTENEIMDGINIMIENYYKDVVMLKKDAAEFLKHLKENGVKLCIATATDKYLVEAALSHTGISEYFSEIFTCNSVKHSKDEPDIFREAMRHLGTDKSTTAVFEDALYAVKTAKKDGFLTVAIYDKYEKEQNEVKALADYHMNDFSDFNSFWKFVSN